MFSAPRFNHQAHSHLQLHSWLNLTIYGELPLAFLSCDHQYSRSERHRKTQRTRRCAQVEEIRSGCIHATTYSDYRPMRESTTWRASGYTHATAIIMFANRAESICIGIIRRDIRSISSIYCLTDGGPTQERKNSATKRYIMLMKHARTSSVRARTSFLRSDKNVYTVSERELVTMKSE